MIVHALARLGEAMAPMRIERHGNERRVMRPLLEHGAFARVQAVEMVRPVGRVAGVQDVTLRALDDADGINLHEAERLDDVARAFGACPRGDDVRGKSRGRRRSRSPGIAHPQSLFVARTILLIGPDCDKRANYSSHEGKDAEAKYPLSGSPEVLANGSVFFKAAKRFRC